MLISLDRAARRFFQIRSIQRAIEACDDSLGDIDKELAVIHERQAELRATKRSLQGDMRAAAKDQGDLPLIDLMDELDGRGMVS